VNSGAVGNTFSIKIPGTSAGQNAQTNSSPQFLVNDTALICKNSFFQLNFSATDPNSDSLSYQFCEAYEGANQQNPSPTTASNPPYITVPYAPLFSGGTPLGSSVTINSTTGLISGVAPTMTGQYVICVCVSEFRNGQLIATTRKELHIEVSDCSPLRAQLNPRPTFCDGLNVNFQNDASENPPNTDYLWNFGDPASGSNNTSTLSTTTHLFSAPGDYNVKLKVTMQGICTDSFTTLVRVWPGFYPGFTTNGNCVLNPYQFSDTTRVAYGVVDYWHWNFGDNSTETDTARIINPQWTYPGPGTATVRLIVRSSKGCTDTIQQTIDIRDKPLITMGFTDTLICQYDSLQLNASGIGNFSWSPNIAILNSNSSSPTVSPMSTTWYYVSLENTGCVNRDSVLVNVTADVFINPMSDTTICQGDTIRLRIASNGIQYSWTPANNLDNPATQSPLAVTNNTTTYQVTGIIGGCSETKQITVRTVPYPIARVSPDTTICFNNSAQLRGNSNGSSFVWRPSQYLNNPSSLSPVTRPPVTQQYILAVFDTRGCPKPGLDTVVITVLPEVVAVAGPDTTVVIGQDLQLNANGGVTYSWSPSTGLSSTTLPNPVARYLTPTNQIRYQLIARDAANCADTAYMNVRVFQTVPSVFIPTAFTPNGDGKNDVLRLTMAGIKELKHFRVFNRWGQLVYETKKVGDTWDGKVNGRFQSIPVFVWTVSAIDFLNQPYFAKGLITLIR
jgi:gliding motility-associated-like protein